MSCRLTFGLGA